MAITYTSEETVSYAEKIVLASVLLDSEKTLPSVLMILDGREFTEQKHSIIFQAIKNLLNETTKIDLVGVTEFLYRTQKLDAIGGPGYLTSLTDNVGSASQAEYYAKIVRENYAAREYLAMAKKHCFEAEQVIKGKGKFQLMLGQHESEIYNLSRNYYRGESLHVEEIINREMENLKKIAKEGVVPGISTNMNSLDSLTNGFRPNELIYLAARPGIGKTAFALNVALACAMNKTAVGLFSIEMSMSDIAKRMLSIMSGIDNSDIKRIELTDVDWYKLNNAAARIIKLPIFINDQHSLTISDLRSQARFLVFKHKIKFLIIDYLQIIRPEIKGRSREQEISDISAQLKSCAKELNIPVLCLAQLNREVERRENKQPRLSDLRESGSLEQDADMVIFLWQEDRKSDCVRFDLAKNRNGRTGSGEFIFNKLTQQFVSVDK